MYIFNKYYIYTYIVVNCVINYKMGVKDLIILTKIKNQILCLF